MVDSKEIIKKHINWLYIGIYMTVVIIVIVAAYFFFRSPSVDEANGVAAPVYTEKQKIIKATFDDAMVSADQGKYEDGQKALDGLLPGLTADLDRASLYLRKSDLASHYSYLEDAVKFAKQAEEAHPTRMTAIFIASTAESMGDTTTALKYYTVVISRTTELEQKNSPDDFEYYKKKVKDLSKS
jgi:tetratricopeptide (TPR) repeat protein